MMFGPLKNVPASENHNHDFDASERSLNQAVWAVTVAGSLVFFFVGSYVIGTYVVGLIPAPAPPAPVPAPGAVVPADPSFIQLEARAMSRTDLLHAKFIAEDAVIDFKSVTNSLQTWNRSELSALMDNELGRAMAQDSRTVEKVAETLGHLDDLETYHVAARGQALVNELIAPVDFALQDPMLGYMASPEYLRKLRDLRASAAKAKSELTRSTNSLVAVASGHREPGTRPQGSEDWTLRQALRANKSPLSTPWERPEPPPPCREETRTDLPPTSTNEQPPERVPAPKVPLPTAASEAGSGVTRFAPRKEHDKPVSDQSTPSRTHDERTSAEPVFVPFEQRREIIEIYRPFTHVGTLKVNRRGERYSSPQPASLSNLKATGVLDNPSVFWATAFRNTPPPSAEQRRSGNYSTRSLGLHNDRPRAQWQLIADVLGDSTGNGLKQTYYDTFLELAPRWVELGVLNP